MNDKGFNISTEKFENEFINELKKYNMNSKTNYLDKDKFKKKINELCNEVGLIKPIDDTEINNVIYFNEYEEIGLSLNKKNVSLKQMWNEYRFLYNNRGKGDNSIMEKSFVLDNFDELFNKISNKIDGVDKYIKDLNSMKKEIDDSNLKLECSRENLELERTNFEIYCKQQSEKLDKREKELDEKLSKVNELMKRLDEKMNEFI